MPTAHCVSTHDGVILAADRGFLDLVRRTENEVIGASYRDLTHPDDLQKSAMMLKTLVDQAPPLRLRKRYVRPDGSSVAALLYVTCFTNPPRLVSTLFWHEAGRELRPERLWEAALRIQHVHSVRRAAFGPDLASDPVGMLLIHVYLAEAEGRVVGVDQLSRQADIPVSVTVRWIKALRQEGILQTGDDGTSDVQFTHDGAANMELTLESVFHLPRSLSDLS